MPDLIADMPDILRDRTVSLTLQGGREFLGMQMIDYNPMLGMVAFIGGPGGIAVTWIRRDHISAIEVWNA